MSDPLPDEIDEVGRPPIAIWREHEGEIPLRLPQGRLRFWLTFLPEQERTLRPTGIHLFGLRYWSAALSADVGRSERRLLVKYDPRDMARIGHLETSWKPAMPM